MGQVADDESAEQTLVGRLLAGGPPPAEYGHFLSVLEAGGPAGVRIGAAGLTIGRAAPAELIIPDPQISRRHCRIELQGDYAVLSDLGSTNGTFLDGARLERPARLRSGARFTLGSVPVRYDRRDLSDLAKEMEHIADLQRAEDYVRAILPAPVTSGPVTAEWCFIPSAKLGGDAFGYQYLSETIFAGFVLDVSGHGIGSAMHAANVANALRRRSLPDTDFKDPAAVAAGLNRVFPMEDHNGLMLTLWYFTYDLASRRLRFCAAGHHPSYLVTPAVPEPAPLWLRSPAIGMLPQAKWQVGEAEMPEGARLFIFSDGAFEIVTAEGRQWGMEDLRQILRRPFPPELPFTQAVYQAVRRAARPGPLDDDFSVLMITFH